MVLRVRSLRGPRPLRSRHDPPAHLLGEPLRHRAIHAGTDPRSGLGRSPRQLNTRSSSEAGAIPAGSRHRNGRRSGRTRVAWGIRSRPTRLREKGGARTVTRTATAFAVLALLLPVSV